MKRTLIIATAALMLGIGVQAQEKNGQGQGRPDPEEMARFRTEMMVKSLGLDETQAAELLELNKDYFKNMGPGPGGPGPERGKGRKARKDTTRREGPGMGPRNGRGPRMSQEQMEQMKADREEYETKLKAILTEEQFKAYQEQLKRAPMGRRGPRDGQRNGRDRD